MSQLSYIPYDKLTGHHQGARPVRRSRRAGQMMGGLVVVFELLWIGQAIRTLSKDIRDFRDPWQKLDRIVIILYWVTALVFALHLSWLIWVFFVRPLLPFIK